MSRSLRAWKGASGAGRRILNLTRGTPRPGVGTLNLEQVPLGLGGDSEAWKGDPGTGRGTPNPISGVLRPGGGPKASNGGPKS